MTVNEHERYDRQVRLWGEEGQKKISSSIATIVGDGPIARDTAMSLTALGVGQIRMIGNSFLGPQRFLDVPIEGSAVHEYRRVLNMINPNVDIVTLQSSIESRTMQYFLEGSSVIIEATNDPVSKALTLDFSRKRGCNVQVLSASSSPGYAKVVRFDTENTMDAIMPGFEGLAQDDLISLGIGGLITEEFKKIVLGQRNDYLKKPVYYNLGGERFCHKNPDNNHPRINKELFRGLRAGVVGAGALGNIASILLAKIGFGRVDYYDYDIVESHNLTRQINFYDCVDKKKSESLALKHRAMNPCDARGICEKFEVKNGVWSIDQLNPEGYDILFDLVDNMYTRACLAAYAVIKGIPLISAASSPDASEWVTFVPGKTPCLDHVFAGYYARGLEEEMIRRRSCTQDPNPAVIMTNQVAGSFAVLESLPIFQPEDFGRPFSGSFKYSTTKDSRLSTRSIRDVCDCHTTRTVPNMEITEEMMRRADEKRQEEGRRKKEEEKTKDQEARGKTQETGGKNQEVRGKTLEDITVEELKPKGIPGIPEDNTTKIELTDLHKIIEKNENNKIKDNWLW